MTTEATAVLEAPAAVGAGVELALIDLSSIAHPIWHMSGQEPDQDFVSRQIVARVRALTRQHPHAAICCDSGRSFRRELAESYKANRPPADAALIHQIRHAQELLEAEGYPVWSAKGMEADDLIASAVKQARAAGLSVLVVSADKDLLQLVGEGVRALSPATNQVYDAEAVRAKFGVRPDQVRDYLTLVGDAADNVKGAQGIGPKRAAELLGKWGDLEGIYDALSQHGTQFTPALASSLRAFEADLQTVRALVTLRADVEIPFSTILAPRVVKDAAPIEVVDMETGEIVEAGPAPEPSQSEVAAVVEAAEVQIAEPAKPATHGPAMSKAPAAKPANALADPAPPNGGALVEYEKQLEPRSLGQASALANALFQARLFGGAYGTPQAVLSTIIAGRELGLQAMASLRAFHIVEGKHQMSADLMRALVLRSGLAESFRCKVRTAERCVFVTQRKGDPEPVELEYTIAEAEAAGLVKEKSGWKKNPADMLVARASSKLARLVYPEIVHGLYAPEEFD